MSVSLKGLDHGSRKKLKKWLPLLEKVNQLGSKMTFLSDKELRDDADKLKRRATEEPLNNLVIESFALVREASKRATGLYPYDVQVLGGFALYYGHIAEMNTGEGKTLVAAMPSFTMALLGRGVHVVTVNDYLAKRDADDIGRIHRFLGMSVGCVLQDMKDDERRRAYACDITYITNSELGFDYLRDNKVYNLKDRVQRELFYCIIDEVDSVLIDESRTPLIISTVRSDTKDLYVRCNAIVAELVRGDARKELSKMDVLSGVRQQENGDYIVDEKNRTVHLTPRGVKTVERLLGINNYASIEHDNLRHYIQIALQAHGLYKRDVDYVVNDGIVEIVDIFTGRIAHGRRFSDGLHQALEAKEGVKISDESVVEATITYQNFFNKYVEKAGMTGTARSSAKEFDVIYHLQVVTIPPNRPLIRKDEADYVYLTKDAKRRAVLKMIVECHKKGQPVLVGTTTIEESEIFSELLTKKHIPHNVLNAKNYAVEANIIATAGEFGQVTIATNMAGRGTDIKLTDASRAAGGLFVIGTERHEARRIDNQLRGRSGRQGDPGRSRFCLSLEDDVTRLFGAERTIAMLRGLGAKENEPIVHHAVHKLIENAQKKIEDNYFSVRKSLLDFDLVNNEQRELIYAQRNTILNGGNPDRFMSRLVDQVAVQLVNNYFDGPRDAWQMDGFLAEWHSIFGDTFTLSTDKEVMYRRAMDVAHDAYRKKMDKYALLSELRDMERYVVLRAIDGCWLQHLAYLDHLKQGIQFYAYGQQDPVLVYKDKAYTGFEALLNAIAFNAVCFFFEIQPGDNPEVYQSSNLSRTPEELLKVDPFEVSEEEILLHQQEVESKDESLDGKVSNEVSNDSEGQTDESSVVLESEGKSDMTSDDFESETSESGNLLDENDVNEDEANVGVTDEENEDDVASELVDQELVDSNVEIDGKG